MKKKERIIQKQELKNVTLELNEAHRKVILWFFSYPYKEMSLNDLSVELGIAKTTARKIVFQLVEEEFLKKEELGKVWRINCNVGHIYNYTIKVANNLENIYKGNIVQEIHKAIPNARAIILFGSYRKGDDTEKSDIDIAVEVLDNEKLSIQELGVIEKFNYRKNVQVNVHLFSRNQIDLNLFNNIANGIMLDGFLEVRP